jgi:hypothetical protein
VATRRPGVMAAVVALATVVLVAFLVLPFVALLLRV